MHTDKKKTSFNQIALTIVLVLVAVNVAIGLGLVLADGNEMSVLQMLGLFGEMLLEFLVGIYAIIESVGQSVI